MLQVEAPFPHAGSIGFVRDTAEAVKVIQQNADGTMLVARELPDGGREARMRFYLRGATRNFTLQREDLFESRDMAVFCRTGRKLPRQRRARSSRK